MGFIKTRNQDMAGACRPPRPEIKNLRYRYNRINVCGKVGVAGLCYNAYTVISACKVGWNWNVNHVCATPIVDGKACKAAFVFKEHTLVFVRNVKAKVASVYAQCFSSRDRKT